MYQRLSAVLFPIVTVALIGTGVWGYQEHQEKNSILIKAENQYQRAFHDLTYYMDQLNNELGETMAVGDSSDQYQKRELIQVWRMTDQAQYQISQLPLTLLPFHKTEEFLDKMAKFTYRASLRDLKKQPLSQEEKSTLKSLYDRSKDLSKELRNIQTKVLDQNLRWMDVEMALATENEKLDNVIIDGFKTVDNKVNEYSEVNWGPSVQDYYETRSVNKLSGKQMSPADIKRKAAAFVGGGNNVRIKVTENGRGTEYSSFSVVAETNNGQSAHMDFSKKGGYLLWFMNSRKIGKGRLTADQAADRAERFLREHKFGAVVPVNYDQYDNVSNVTFAASEGGVVYYPRKVTVKVAMDNGQVVGVQAHDYVYESKPPNMADPAMTMDDAAKRLNTSFRRTEGRKAFIKNDMNEKVLCYEYTGRINGGLYRIFLNAGTGVEEKVERIEPVEAAFKK